MVLSQKKKCRGCRALRKVIDQKTGDEVYMCAFGLSMTFGKVGLTAFSPKPMEGVKCYKPLSNEELHVARKMYNV